MKGQQDEEKLTSYVLGELPAAEAAMFDYAVSADPALRLAADEVEKFQSSLAEVLGGGSEKLMPRHKAAIMRAAREATRGGKVEMLKSHRKSPKVVYFWPFAAAAVVAMGVFVMTMLNVPEGREVGKSVASHQANPAQDKENLEGFMPTDLASGSLAVIAKAVRVEKRMPMFGEVDLVQLLEAYPMQFKQAVALKADIVLGVEVIPCPWNASSSLVFASVKSSSGKETVIDVRYRSAAADGGKAEFLGFKQSELGFEKKLKAESIAIFVMLVEDAGEEVGILDWKVDEEDGPGLILKREQANSSTADARFAQLICGYALWMQKADKHVDAELVLGLAREAEAGNELPDRYDFLELVDSTMKLSGVR